MFYNLYFIKCVYKWIKYVIIVAKKTTLQKIVQLQEKKDQKKTVNVTIVGIMVIYHMIVQIKKSSTEKACYSCGQQGHISKYCTKGGNSGSNNEDRKCYSCGQCGHISSNCTQRTRKDECYKCGKTGHRQADCTQGGGSSSRGGRGGYSSRGCGNCYTCGKEGHLSRDCTGK